MPEAVRFGPNRAASIPGPINGAATTDLQVNTASREETRQFFRTVYAASENVPMGWTGNYTAPNAVTAAGTTSAAYQQAVLLRINFFRAMAGVPATVTLNPTYSAKDQQAALMMSANGQLRHTGIPTTWTYYTEDGAQAASQSNLSLGLAGPAAVTSLIQDSDGSGSLVSIGANAIAGHRRWFLYPQTREVGVGDVPGNGTLNAAHASWITAQFGLTRPATRDNFVAYPAPGYAPYQLVFPRWSFGLAGADFSGATVTMTRDGAPIAVRLEPINNAGGGENTLVWLYDSANQTTVESPGHVRPTADVAYEVTIANVKNGTTTLPPFKYTVKVFDPDVAGPDATPVTITAAAIPTVGTAGMLNVAKPAFAAGFEWRTLTLSSYAKVYTGDTGLDGLTATITPGVPAVVQSAQVARGAAAFRLTHINPRGTQILTLPENFLVRSDGSLRFASRLGIATPIQTARVQVSTDDGAAWSDVYTQAGTSNSGSSQPVAVDATFATRTVSLASYVGRTIRVRFAFTIEQAGSAFIPDDANLVGWFLDDITVAGVQTATASAPAAVAAGAAFSYTPAALGPFVVQARATLFGTYPLEWGPAAELSAFEAGDSTNPGRIINLSVLTSVATAGDNFTLGYVVGGLAGSQGGKPLVIRAAGPSLGALGVAGTLDDPKLETFTGQTKTGENNDWGGSATVSAAMNAVGAFPFTGTTSKDAAVSVNITTRDNSVKVSANGNGTGTVIAEVYDATPSAAFTATTPRLINVSVNKHLGTGVTAGFVLGGSTPTRVLIRVVGPGLAAFGVGGTVADPQLALFNDKSVKIGENNDWGGTAELSAAFNAVGAFTLSPTSKDAALLVLLSPGLYSVQASGVNNTTGTAIVEVYEVP